MVNKCDKEQRELIYNNSKDILITENNCEVHVSAFYHLMIVILWAISIVVGLLLGTDKLNKFVYVVYLFGSYYVILIIVGKCVIHLSIRKKLKHLVKNDKISINGATITRVDKNSGCFEYIEDDVTDHDQKKYINLGNTFSKKTKKFHSGDRIVILYGVEKVFDKTYVMKTSEQTSKLIPDKSPDFNLNDLDSYTYDIETYKRDVIDTVPNPSCAKICKEKYYISEEEKNRIQSIYFVKDQLAQIKKMYTISGIVMEVGMNFLTILLSYTYGCSIPVICLLDILANLVVIIFILKMYSICKNNKTGFPISNTVKEVVYINTYSYDKGMYKMRVFEWNNRNEIECKEYPLNLYGTANEGDILYKMKISNAYYFYKK